MPETNLNSIIMKHCILFAAAIIACFFSEGLQAQVLKNNAKPDVLFINRRGAEVDTMSATQVIDLYYSTIEKGFRQTGLPKFIISGKDQKMIFGIGGNVNTRLSYDFDGIANDLDFAETTSAVPARSVDFYPVFQGDRPCRQARTDRRLHSGRFPGIE